MKTVQTMLAEAEAEVPRISPDEAKGLLGRADVLFLDVREPAEVATSGKVPGALAVPRGLVEFRADPASAMHDKAFDRAKTVIAYCASGGRSALVGKTLKGKWVIPTCAISAVSRAGWRRAERWRKPDCALAAPSEARLRPRPASGPIAPRGGYLNSGNAINLDVKWTVPT